MDPAFDHFVALTLQRDALAAEVERLRAEAGLLLRVACVYRVVLEYLCRPTGFPGVAELLDILTKGRSAPTPELIASVRRDAGLAYGDTDLPASWAEGMVAAAYAGRPDLVREAATAWLLGREGELFGGATGGRGE